VDRTLAISRWGALAVEVVLLAGCPGPVDEDGDRWSVELDCDDSDPAVHPEADELCNGLDDDCDPDSWAEGEQVDADGDGVLGCDDCDDADPAIHPGAAPFCADVDADCDGEADAGGDPPGDSADCPGVSCATLLEADPSLGDGSYWIDAGRDVAPFVVSCEMTDAGGGWIRLAVDDDDGVLVASQQAGNPWDKCDDDSAAFYLFVQDEDDLPEDIVPGHSFLAEVPLGYVNPDSGEVYGDEAVAAMRTVIDELHPVTRIVATVGDDDNGTWQDGGGGGHEVYAVGSDGTWVLLTPGSGGDCGGATGWPSAGSQTGTYLWSTDPSLSGTVGDVGEEPLELGALPREALLPVYVELAVYTGGGVSFGWATDVFLVR
jgi:hypothetical protein